MNTPRTKPLTRFGQPLKRKYEGPDGHYTATLLNDLFVLAVGRIATFFPSLENGMIDLMADLMGGEDPPARQVYFSIVNQNARIKVMTAMLEQSSLNMDKNETYDKIITDFTTIKNKRNEYVHGIWWTHNTGRVFLASPEPDEFSWHNGREVLIQELEHVVQQMNDLAGKLKGICTRRLRERAQRQALRQEPPAPPDKGTSSTPPAIHTSDEGPAAAPQQSDPSSS